MKFATIALMAVAMFAADAEAKKKRGVTAKCSFPDPEEDDGIKGGFYLSQRTRKDESFKYIGVGGKIWNGEKGLDYSAQLHGDAECGAAEGDAIALKEGRGWRRSIALKGRVGDGGDDQVLLTDWTGKSIALVDDSFVTVACRPISEIVDHSSEESEARLLEDMFDQN